MEIALILAVVVMVDLGVAVESLMVTALLKVKVLQIKDMMVVQELENQPTLEVVAVEPQLRVETEIVQMVQFLQDMVEQEELVV